MIFLSPFLYLNRNLAEIQRHGYSEEHDNVVTNEL